MSSDKKKSGLATAGMVLGIIGAVLAFIPIINNLAFVLGVIAVIFGGIALAKKASKGKAIAAVILGVVSILITIMMQQAFSDAIDDATAPTQTSPSSSDSEPAEEDENSEGAFDGNAAFDSIENGMTKAEVRDVTGVEPTSCTESEDPTFGTVEYCSYGNMFTDDVTVDVTFSDGVVSNKSRTGNTS